MQVAITGGTGMIGTWLANVLRDRGDEVVVLTRATPAGPHEMQWDPARGVVDVHRLEGFDALVHLSGAPVADRPWTRMRRQVLRDSRVAATDVLVDSLERLDAPPRVFLGAGGLGLYGDTGDTTVDESAPAGTGFLAELSADWEEAHDRARILGARVVVLRLATVLSPTGGVFPLMVQPFRLGLGGWLGDGQQFTAWVSIRDVVGSILHLLDDGEARGAYNCTSPEPVRMAEWCGALGRVLGRRTTTHAPEWVLRGAFGELADALLLASLRAVPRRLEESGYTFIDPDPEATFRWLVQTLDAMPPDIARHKVSRRRRRRGSGRAGR